MPIVSRASTVPIFCSTRTIRSTGIRGATRRSRSARATKTSRSSSRSATRPATGATSWSTSRSRTRDVAAVLNEHFVAIKVDREERPDVDRVYMMFVQATTGAGGWPMSVWLTPELKPFFGGTYFPPTSRWGRPGSSICSSEIARVWRDERDKVLRVGRRRLDRPRRRGGAADGARRRPRRGAGRRADSHGVAQFAAGVRRAARRLRRCAEISAAVRAAVPAARARAHRRRAPRARWRWRRCGRWRSAACAITSAAASIATRSTATGACRTSRRCSTTRRSSCSRISKRRRSAATRSIAEVAEDTLDYVRRDLTDADGRLLLGRGRRQRAARSRPTRRGRTRRKARSTSGRDDEIGDAARRRRRDRHARASASSPAATRRPIRRRSSPARTCSTPRNARGRRAAATGRALDEVAGALQRARQTLFDARATRPRPHLDDKVLTAWNGLMIAAFARRARPRRSAAGGRATCTDAARSAPRVRPRASVATPRRATLLRRYRDGDAGVEGYGEDYAYLILGLLELFQATGDAAWLEWALSCSAARTRCSGTRTTAAGSARPARTRRAAAAEGGLRRRRAGRGFARSAQSADAGPSDR